MSDQPPKKYDVNDVVWVKFRSMWWPGIVCDIAQVPDDTLKQLRKPPFAVVRFFGERTFEIIKNPNGILPYRCPQKFDFIKKGLALFRKDYKYTYKFPSDVQLAEKRTGGDAHIFERDDEFTLNPIDAKTAKLLAQQREERGEPMPGEGDSSSLTDSSDSGSSFCSHHTGKQDERALKKRERAEMHLRAEIPFTEEEIREQRQIEQIIDQMQLSDQMQLIEQMQLREAMQEELHLRGQMQSTPREFQQEFAMPHNYEQFTHLVESMQSISRESMPTMPIGFKIHECPHHPEHVRQQLDLLEEIRRGYQFGTHHNYEQFGHLLESMQSTSRASGGQQEHEHTQQPEPKPSTSRESMPSTSRESMPSTSRESMPSTSRESMPSTSRESMPSTSRESMPSTSRASMAPSTECQCPHHKDHVIFKQPLPPTSKEPIPSTSRGSMPSTSRESMPSTESKPSTSREQTPSKSKASKSEQQKTSKSKTPTSKEQIYATYEGSVPSKERMLAAYNRQLKTKSKYPTPSPLRSDIRWGRVHGPCIPLRRYIPPVPAPERIPPVPAPASNDRKKKRGRKKKNIVKPPAPGTSRLKGESNMIDLDIYRDLDERLAALPKFTDRSKPLPLYLRPESIWRPPKVVPPPMPPSNKMHPIPEKEGEYKCHLCKYSCDRQNNIISHIKLHNYGKSLKLMARKIYVKYVARLMLDEREIITIVDSSDEEEKQQEETVPGRDEDCSFVDYGIHCEEIEDSSSDSDGPPRRPKQKSPPRNLRKMSVMPVYRKVTRNNTNLPTTSRAAVLKTRALINQSKRSILPIEAETEQPAVNKNLPSTSRAGNTQSPQPSTSRAATTQSPQPSTSRAATTQSPPLASGENMEVEEIVDRENEGSVISSSSSEPEFILDKILRLIPREFIEAERRTELRMPPIPLVNIPLRRACTLSRPIRYFHPWEQRRGVDNPLHYLPPPPRLTLPFPFLIPYKRKIPRELLPQVKKFQRLQEPQESHEQQQLEQTQQPEQLQQSQRLTGKKRSYQDIKKPKTDNENVREILKDWEDEDTTNNPIPSTSKQNVPDEQHPTRLEDAVGILHGMHEEKKNDDDDEELNSPQRKVRNIPKKDRNRAADDPNHSILIIQDIQIIPPEQKHTDETSTSKETDKEDKNSEIEMQPDVTVTSEDNTEVISRIGSEDQHMEDISTETDDNHKKLDKNGKNFKDLESENQQTLKLNVNSNINVNTEITANIEKYKNYKDTSNSIQIIENIQILPSKPLIKFPSNENNDSVENITSTDKKIIQEIVERINEVNERIIERNTVQSEEIIIKINEGNENNLNDIKIPKDEEHITVSSQNLEENCDKKIQISSNESEAELDSVKIDSKYKEKSMENVVESSEYIPVSLQNIPETSEIISESKNIREPTENIPESENILKSENIPESSKDIQESEENIPESLEDIQVSAENIPEFSEDIQESAENLTNLEENSIDNLPSTIKIPNNNFEEKNKVESSLYIESSLDIAIRDLITPFEPKKKLPISRKAHARYKRGETQSIRKSSRKSDNIYKILGREITTPSPSPANMVTSDNEISLEANPSTSTKYDSSSSASEFTQKSAGSRGRRSKKNLRKIISMESEKPENIDVTILKNTDELIENVVEQSVEIETENVEEESSEIVPKNLTSTLKKGILKEDQEEKLHEEKETIENLKSSRILRKTKQEDRRKSSEKEEIPKIIIKSPKNSNENPKIIRKISLEKQLQESSPKKISKLTVQSPEADKSSILITSTTNEIPTTSNIFKTSDEIVVEEKQGMTVPQKSAISCFDFNEDEEDDEIILTPLNKLKKKYMSPPDKYKDEIDSKKIKETEQKDQLLTAEIENILNNTKVPELKKIEIIAETSIASREPTLVEETLQISVPTSSSFDSNTQDVKGLPIKERGKRFFKSRNRPKTDENIITTANVLVPTDSEEIKSTNINQDKNIAEINTIGDNMEEMKTRNNDIPSITEKTSIETKNISGQTDNTIKSLDKSTIENIDTDLLSKTTSENELFIAETLLSFPNTVTETTSTLKNLENINVKLQNLTEDQQQIGNNPMTGKLIQPITERRTQIRVKSLEKLNQQFEDSILQGKDIGKPIEFDKPCLPLEHITRRRRSHLKITPRKRVLQQPVKLETNISPKSDDILNVSAEKQIDEHIDTPVSESKISKAATDKNKINEPTILDSVPKIDTSTNKINNDNLTNLKTKVTTESENSVQQYEESFVEKYMKESKIFDVLAPTEKIEKVNISLDSTNKKEDTEHISTVIQPASELVNPEKIVDSVILEPSQTVSSTENIKNKKIDMNEPNLPTSTSSSSSIKLTPSTQSISDIRSFRPRRKTSNKRSPSFSSEYPSNRRSSTECQIDVENKIEKIVDRTVTDEPKTIDTCSTSNITDKLDTIKSTISEPNISDNLDTIKQTDKLTIDTTDYQQDQQHQLSPTIEKIQINVDLANPLTTQIAKIFGSNNPVTKATDDVTPKLPTSEQVRSATIKRKSTIEEEIPMFLIEKTKSVNEQKDAKSLSPSSEKIQKTTAIKSAMKLPSATSTSYGQTLITGEKSEISITPINTIPSTQLSTANKNTLGSGKLIITQLRDTTISQGKSDTKQEQPDISNIFDFTNMPILIANESTLPYIVTTTATTISQAVTLSMSTTSHTTPSISTTIVKRQGRGRPRKIVQTTIISTTPITTLSSSLPKYTSTSQQTFNKTVSKNISTYTQQQVQQIQNNSNANINNYPIIHQTHTQQILDSQNYNLHHSASNSSSAGKEVGIDSKGNRFILIKHGNSQKMVKQSISTVASLSPTDISKTKFSNFQTKPLQQQSSEIANINVISSEVILPPKSIKNPTTNTLITKRIHQSEQQLHQPTEKKTNLLGQSGQLVITSKGAVIQTQNIQPTTTSSQILTVQGQQQSHISGESHIIQQHPSTSSDINQQQMYTESNIIIHQNQPPPLTKGKITSISQQRGRKRKHENVMICYNENQLDMPPLTAIQQNLPSTSTDLKKLTEQHQEQDTKKLKLLEKQIPTTHSIENVTNVANQLVSAPTTQGICDDELQTNKIMAVPASHFGIPGSAYYLCSHSPEGDYLPIDSQKLYLDPDVNQLVPLTCLSKNVLAAVLASEEAAVAAAQVQSTAIVLQTDDTDALIEETTEIEQSELEEEISAKHNVEIQLLAAQQQQVADQQKIENRHIIDNETVFGQTPDQQYIVESNTGTVEQITDNIVGATVGATATASTDGIDNIICLDIDENQQQVIAIDESNIIADISGGSNTTSAAITPVAAENLLTAEDVSGFLGSDQSIVINVDGQQLILDQQSFLALAATGGESAQLETAEGQTYILSREFLAALGIGGGGMGSTANNDSQNVNDETQILLHDNSELSATNHDILAAALAGTEVYYQQQPDTDLMNLQIETSNGIVQQLVGEETLTFQHLTPPVTAQTNETSALLTQPPIMSALEVPSNKKLNKSINSNKIYNNRNELTIEDGNIISNINNNTSNDRLLTTIPPQNLDECIAFIGVSTQSSTVPSSLELPITITNPAIAPPKNSTNPIDDTIFNTKGLGVPSTTIANIIAGSSSQISPHLITCNGEQELQYELFTTTQTTSQQQKSTANSQSDDVFQSNFDDPTR